MPVFNEEERIRWALESALFQRTDFKFEVIVVDDGSTDQTVNILEQYQKVFSNLLVIKNSHNLGKGPSFKKAYAKARGEYFHVLDGDDYFISYDKVQKQVEVLDANPHIFAVAHNTVVAYPDNSLGILNSQLHEVEYSYEYCISFGFYHHTSAFMIRKLAGELPEEFATIKTFGGDVACLFFHAFIYKQGVKFLPDLSSCYYYNGRGIWSSLDANTRHIKLKELLGELRDFIIRVAPYSIERALLNQKIEQLCPEPAGHEAATSGNLILEDILMCCYTVAPHVRVVVASN